MTQESATLKSDGFDLIKLVVGEEIFAFLEAMNNLYLQLNIHLNKIITTKFSILNR